MQEEPEQEQQPEHELVHQYENRILKLSKEQHDEPDHMKNLGPQDLTTKLLATTFGTYQNNLMHVPKKQFKELPVFAVIVEYACPLEFVIHAISLNRAEMLRQCFVVALKCAQQGFLIEDATLHNWGLYSDNITSRVVIIDADPMNPPITKSKLHMKMKGLYNQLKWVVPLELYQQWVDIWQNESDLNTLLTIFEQWPKQDIFDNTSQSSESEDIAAWLMAESCNLSIQ